VAKKPAVSIYIRIRNAERKQQYCPAIWERKNTKLKPGWCLVKGIPEEHPEGTYNLRYAVNGVYKWEAVDGDAESAVALRSQRRDELAHPKGSLAKYLPDPASGTAAKKPGAPEQYRLEDEIKVYLTNVEKLAPRTHTNYKLTLDQFQQACPQIIYVDEIKKQHLQTFDTILKERGDEDRTRANKIQHFVTFLRNKEGRRAGPPIENVSIRIKYVEQAPEAYTRQELENLFRVSSDDDKMLWRFLLGTGYREAEASVAEYTDVNPEKRTIAVMEKRYFGFKPKDSEKRVVPIPDELIAQLKARKNGCSLVFHKNGHPDGHLLRRLKNVAFRGGLNCGKCAGTQNGKEVSCADAPVCQKWILHRFRKNFATDRHDGGASARKIQKWLGHSSLETTLRYLAVGDDTSEEVRSIVNGVHVGL